jgi:hypothetical protein
MKTSPLLVYIHSEYNVNTMWVTEHGKWAPAELSRALVTHWVYQPHQQPLLPRVALHQISSQMMIYLLQSW